MDPPRLSWVVLRERATQIGATVDRPKSVTEPAQIGTMLCVIVGMMIGAAVARSAVASWLPPRGQGFDVVQLVASGVGGGLGAVLCLAAWSLVARLSTRRRSG